jgi:hypothetical protein
MYAVVEMPMSILGYIGIIITQIWCLNILHTEYDTYSQIVRLIFGITIAVVLFGCGEYVGTKTMTHLASTPEKL